MSRLLELRSGDGSVVSALQPVADPSKEQRETGRREHRASDVTGKCQHNTACNHGERDDDALPRRGAEQRLSDKVTGAGWH
jgi:hypothetical protein